MDIASLDVAKVPFVDERAEDRFGICTETLDEAFGRDESSYPQDVQHDGFVDLDGFEFENRHSLGRRRHRRRVVAGGARWFGAEIEDDIVDMDSPTREKRLRHAQTRQRHSER